MTGKGKVSTGVESIKHIQIETVRKDKGIICTHGSLFFKSGKKFKTNTRSFDNKAEQFWVGECVTAFYDGDGRIISVQKL